ncbi:PIN domain-containing protein [Infundibulicybe gibba]|nr:PIN domain-containing protein [Infundibulicybe gibba]
MIDQDSHFHATLQRIDDLANEDVEMQAPLSETCIIVVDTNILLGYLEVLKRFVADVEREGLPVVLVVPGIVLHELDGQKNRGRLAWFARRASGWLLKKIQERKTIKGQANAETCKTSGNWKTRDDRTNDDLIVDCCSFFKQSCRTFLCSADKILCIKSSSEGVGMIIPAHQWSSRDIAQAIYGYAGEGFGGYQLSYSDPDNVSSHDASLAPKAAADDSDMMSIDEDASVPLVLEPSHALDLLHIQVVDHFTGLLVELVRRVKGPGLANDGGMTASLFAPKPFSEDWTSADCVDYLTTTGQGRALGITNPRVEVFLSKPYTHRGARRGQDWSRRDWEVGLGALANLGDLWEEKSIRETLGVLEPHFHSVFARRMRPTGI